MPAILLLSDRTQYVPGEFTEAVVWMFPPSARFPGGVKFRFAYVKSSGGRPQRLYGIDNAHGAAHEHRGVSTLPLDEADWRALHTRFLANVRALREGRA